MIISLTVWYSTLVYDTHFLPYSLSSATQLENTIMVLNVSLDGGSTWSLCTPGLVDFEQYPALELRFVEGVDEEELPSWIAPSVLEEEVPASV
jgi:hypothetical protein